MILFKLLSNSIKITIIFIIIFNIKVSLTTSTKVNNKTDIFLKAKNDIRNETISIENKNYSSKRIEKSFFNIVHGCKNLKNKSFTYNNEDIKNFKYEIIYVPFHTRLEERAINEKPTLYIQQPNTMVSEDNITYIYKNHDETEDRVIDLNKIVFYISLQKLEKNKIITVIDIHIPYQYTYETGLTSFEIFQVHSCNEKYAFISELVYVKYNIEFNNVRKKLAIITKKSNFNKINNGTYIKVDFGKSNFTEKDTKALIINSLNQLKKNDFSDENLSIIILTSYGKYSELTIQPYFYPPLNTKKIYNLQYINITYFSDNIDTINIVKKPIYKRKELPSGEMPGFDPTNIVFDKHKVIKYSPKVIENMIIFKNIIYPKLIFFYHTLITAEDIIYVTNPLEYVKSNPTKISYNISYQKKDIEKYELKVNVVLPISFISYDALKFFKINAIYPIGYDFIIPTLKSTIMIAIDNSTLLLLDDYPYVTKRSDSVTDSIFLDSKKMEIECWETINEAINIDNFIVLPKEYKNDVVLNKLRKENKDIIFFNYKISKFNDKKRDFYTEVYLNKNSVLNDGTFKYNCKINVPDVMKNNINNILLSYIIEKPKPSDDLELNYDEILIKGVDKTFFNIYYHSPLIKKNQVKSKKILSISEIEEYRQMDTSDINVLLLLVKNSNYGTYKFNIYVIIPYEYMNENFGQPITIVPSYSSTNKLLQSASIEYIIANNHKYINDIKKFSYDIQILEHNEQIRITHKPNIKKLYIKLNGKSIKKEDVDVYYKNDLTLKPIKNNSKTNVIIEFDRTNIGNVYVKANIKIPHNFLIKDDDPTILIIHDVDPYYNVSQRIKTITTYDEGEPQSYCSVIGINDECEKFIVPFEERINLISGKVPRLYIFLKTDKISPDNVKIFYKPYINGTKLINGTDINIYVTSNIINQCDEDVNIIVIGKNIFKYKINPVSIKVIYPQHIHGLKNIKQTFLYY